MSCHVMLVLVTCYVHYKEFIQSLASLDCALLITTVLKLKSKVL